MFQEALANHTAEHLRTHMADLLITINDQFSGSDRLTLRVPEVNSTTLVGGAMVSSIDSLPAVGVDCIEKQAMPSSDGLYLYEYSGGIAGMVKGGSAREVDSLSKRYAGAVELFIRDHQFLHLYETDDFSVREFLYQNTGMSGAIEIEREEESPLWVAAFTIVTLWVTSEDGYRQH